MRTIIMRPSGPWDENTPSAPRPEDFANVADMHLTPAERVADMLAKSRGDAMRNKVLGGNGNG